VFISGCLIPHRVESLVSTINWLERGCLEDSQFHHEEFFFHSPFFLLFVCFVVKIPRDRSVGVSRGLSGGSHGERSGGVLAEPLHQPHDKLFKRVFSSPAETAGILKPMLSSELCEQLDWERMELVPNSFVDSEFRAHESDLLFRLPIKGDVGNPLLVYLLFEHVKKPMRFQALQILRYMVRIWESEIRKAPEIEELPVVWPLVLAQTAEGWTVANRFADLFGSSLERLADLRPVVPDFRYQVIELGRMPYDRIQGTAAGVLTMRVMKAEAEGRWLEDSVWDESLLGAVSQELFEFVLRYIFGVSNEQPEVLLEKLERLKQESLKETAMTVAEYLHDKGLERGLERGRVEGQRRSILGILSARFGEVPEGLEAELGEIEELERLEWLLREAAIAQDLAAFLGKFAEVKP